MKIFKILRNTALLVFCFHQAQASGAAPRCVGIYTQQPPLIESGPSHEALSQIRKDLQGNRPLIAVLRGAKKDPQLEMALVSIFRSLAPRFQVNLLTQTGFEIQNDKLILRKEVKTADKAALSELTKQALEFLRNEAQVAPSHSDSLNVSLQAYRMNDKFMFQQAIYFLRYASEHITGNPDPAWLQRRELLQEFSNAMTTDSAAYYYLSELGQIVGPNGLLYKANGPLLPVQIKAVFKALFKREGPSSPAALLNEKQKFIDIIKDISRRGEEAMALLQKQQFHALAEGNQGSSTKAAPSSGGRSSSLRELLKDLNGPEAQVICDELSRLIRSVDSSAKQNELIEKALQNEEPQIKLLEVAYKLKKHDDLTQKEIQAAVYAALEQVTAPTAAVPITEPSAVVSPPIKIENEIERPPSGERLSSPKGADVRIASLKRSLFSSDSFADASLQVSIHNEKEFFEVFRPGTPGFARLEADADGMKEKLQRVAHYFTSGSAPIELAGDGHFGRFNHRIFSLRWGTYRLLLGLNKSVQGPPRLVVLAAYQKGDTRDSSKKEDHFYELAEQRRLQGEY